MASGRIARFAAAVERQMLELVRGNPRRLVVLLTRDRRRVRVHGARGVGHSARRRRRRLRSTGALAVETFSRVASFGVRVHPGQPRRARSLEPGGRRGRRRVGGGAALALARRLRGLFWAGLGLAIYPRARDDRHRRRTRRTPVDDAAPAGPTLLYLPHDATRDASRPRRALAGLPIAERVLRSALTRRLRPR